VDLSKERPAFVGEALGHFDANSSWQDIRPDLRHEAKRSLLNFIGGAIGVAHSPPIETAVKLLRAFSGPPQATVFGRPERLDILNAAFVNAAGANLLDYDDTHLSTVIHPTAPVAPAVFALAEQLGSSGSDVLHAFILGAEIECRLGNSVSPGHYARGWHITATCGVFGAAAASARLLGLTAAQTWNALGIAAGQAAGLVENLPSAAKNVGVGNAARNGLVSALFAQQGYTAAPAAIEGPLGWARAAGDTPNMTAITGDLADRWEFMKNTYKPYPCGIVLHAVIDACLDLRRECALSAGQVGSVTVSGHPLLLARADRFVANERDARVSIQHSAAVALLFGAAGLHEFSADIVMNPQVAAFRDLVRAEVDQTLPVGAAKVVIDVQGGQRLEATVTHARGSYENPLTDADLEFKVRDLARYGNTSGDIEQVIEHVWSLDEPGRLHGLMAACSA
jgi:2-methylcitrate dehydratase PrpD